MKTLLPLFASSLLGALLAFTPACQRSTATTAAPPQACAGHLEFSESFIDSEDGMSCKVKEHHCITPDRGRCPQVAPPNCLGEFATEPNYAPSADGMECPLPKTYCLHPDTSKCPQLSPPGPNFCPTGHIVSRNHYVPHPDGEFCRMTTPVCVTANEAMCAQK